MIRCLRCSVRKTRVRRDGRSRCPTQWLFLLLLSSGLHVTARASVTVLHSDLYGIDIAVTTPLRFDTVSAGTERRVRLGVEDWPVTTTPGSPEIPYLVVPLVIPPTGGAQAMIVTRDDTSARVGPVTQAVEDRPIGLEEQDGASGGSGWEVPQASVSVELLGIARDVRLARLVIRPVDYAEGTVRWAKRLHVVVRFTSPPRARPARLGAGTSASHPAGLAVNGALIDAFRVAPPMSRAAASGTGPKLQLFINGDGAFEGIYRVTGADLASWGTRFGIDFSTVDPGTFRLEHLGQEVPMYVEGLERRPTDETFAMEFYARPNLQRFQSVAPDLYRDPFVDMGIYVLSWGGKPLGARMAEEDGSITVSRNDPDFVECIAYRRTVHGEQDRRFDRIGGLGSLGTVPANLIDRYFWEGVGAAEARSFGIPAEYPAQLSGYVPERPVVEIMGRGRSYRRHIVDFFMNESFIGSVGRDSIVRDVDLFRFRSPADARISMAPNGNNTIQVQVGDLDPESGDVIYLNWIEVTYDRLYKAFNDYIAFRRPSTPTSGAFDYTITGFTSQDISIYKVGVSRLTNLTVLQKPQGITPEPISYQVRFQDRLEGDDPQYIALTSARKLSPARVVYLPAWPRSLRDPSQQGEYLVIAHPTLIDTVRRLADYRRTAEGGGFTVAVVNARQVYDEFDYGYPTGFAIRDFIRFATQHWSVPPRYVLLVGDGILKFTDEWMKRTEALIPALGESLLKWGLSGSDLAYALVQDDDLLPDLYVGRIPAPDNTSLRTAIEKIIAFERSPSLATPWRNTVFLVAEGEAGFVAQNEALSEEFPAQYNQKRVYNADIPYPQLTQFYGGQRETLEQLNLGSLWTIYLGHGGGGVWGANRLLTHEHPQVLTNIGRAGVFLSMTCFTGAFDDPNPETQSLAELMLFAPGGAIGWVGSTGLGWVTNDFFLTQSILRVATLSPSDELRLGQIVTMGKIDYLMRFGGPKPLLGSFPHSMVYMYNLIGDPALRIVPPETKVALDLSTRTPLLGGLVTVKGTVPEPAATGTAWLALYDDRELQVFPATSALPAQAPMVNGSFQANIAVPTGIWGTGLTLKAYVSSTAPTKTDWSGYARLSVAGVLIDSVVVSSRSRDSIYVSATVHSIAPVKAVVCSVLVSSDGQGDLAVAMAALDGTNRYRTTAPLDLSHLPPDDPEAFVRPVIIVVDSSNQETRRADLPAVYPNTMSRLQIGNITLSGVARAELTGAITNGGEIASDSVILSANLLAGGVPAQLLHEERLTPLAPLSKSTTPVEDAVLLPKAGRRSSDGDESVGSGTYVPQRARLAIPLADSLVDGRSPGAVVLLTVRSVDGRSKPDSALFEVPANIVSYDPARDTSTAVYTPSGQSRLDLAKSALSGPTLVRLVARSAPTQNGQPDLNVPGAKVGHPVPACEVAWLAPVETTASGAITLTFAIDQNDTNLQRALTLNQLRIGYWNDDRKQWEVISASLHTWAPDNSWVQIRVSRPGVYAFVQVDDQTGPTIEISASGQQFGEGAYVNELTKFLVLVEDRNGVSTTPGDLRAWIDDVRLPDSTISLPTHTTSVTAVPFTVTSPLLTAREKPYGLRIEARDAAGNTSSEEVSFQVAVRAAVEFYGNFPNPFGADGTVFAFRFTQQMREVVFRIFDVSGRQVLRFSNYDLSQLYPDDPPELHRANSPSQLRDRLGRRLFEINYHELEWSGRGSDGQALANGVYLCMVTARDDDTGRLVAEHTFTMVKAE